MKTRQPIPTIPDLTHPDTLIAHLAETEERGRESRNLLDAIEMCESSMWALHKRMGESYTNVWRMLDDAENLGKLAARIKLLRSAATEMHAKLPAPSPPSE